LLKNGKIKISDFGKARFNDTSMSAITTGESTPIYMSLEMIRKIKSITKKTDIW
jgi:serine/threonine protein kinase